MKLKGISIIVLVIYLLALFTNVSASEYTPVNKATNEAYVISRDNFSLYFSGPVSEFALASQTMRSTLGKTNLTVSDATVTGDQLTCNLHIPVAEGYTILPISGKLRSSFRAQNGMNSIIVEVDHKVNGYTVRLFEIVNDTKEDTFLLYQSVDATKSVSSQPHLRVYLEDNNGMLFLLESVLPTSLQGLKATEYEKADKYKDAIFWLSDLVEHKIELFEVTDEVLQEFGIITNTRGIDSFTTWMPEVGYSDTFYAGYTQNVCHSLPYFKYMHSNIEDSGNYTWVASFRIAEHNRGGEDQITYYGYNTFSYSNLEISLGCGDCSTILQSYRQGRGYRDALFTRELIEEDSDLTINILKYAASNVNYGSTITSVLEILSNMIISSETVTIGTENLTIYGDKILAVGESVTDVEFETCTDQPTGNFMEYYTDVGDYYTMHFGVRRYNPRTTTTTTAVLKVKFDVMHQQEVYDSLDLTFPLEYTVYNN